MDWKYEKGRIYSVDENNELMAETTFVFKKSDVIDINRTYVHPELRGQGLAGKLMGLVAEYLRENSLKATASCPYANTWLKRNRESYSDIISEEL
ncbi:MAG: N-acetyltransferase [Halanaerobiaceae bacterium]|jgi:predicted GNAT family acetyltransferase|nr:N-acetyltransferase [Halanaerobiaceae bacterium]